MDYTKQKRRLFEATFYCLYFYVISVYVLLTNDMNSVLLRNGQTYKWVTQQKLNIYSIASYTKIKFQ